MFSSKITRFIFSYSIFATQFSSPKTTFIFKLTVLIRLFSYNYWSQSISKIFKYPRFPLDCSSIITDWNKSLNEDLDKCLKIFADFVYHTSEQYNLRVHRGGEIKAWITIQERWASGSVYILHKFMTVCNRGNMSPRKRQEESTIFPWFVENTLCFLVDSISYISFISISHK